MRHTNPSSGHVLCASLLLHLIVHRHILSIQSPYSFYNGHVITSNELSYWWTAGPLDIPDRFVDLAMTIGEDKF